MTFEELAKERTKIIEEYKRPRLNQLKADTVLDEEKSVRWNREEVKRINEENKEKAKKIQEEYSLKIRKNKEEIMKKAKKEYPCFSDKDLERIYSEALEEEHYQVVYEFVELLDFISELSIYQNHK